MHSSNKPWVLLDVSYLAHRARMTTDGLEQEDLPTGVLFGFFSQLLHICSHEKVLSSRLALFTDSAHSFRREAYPTYKQKRREEITEEERIQKEIMWKQIKLLKHEYLPLIGLKTYQQRGLESDDLIAWVANDLTRRKEKGIMITGDGDLYQCITHMVSWFDPGRETFYTPETFEKKKGMPARNWGILKALAGCHTDEVRGIPGVGDKTAIAYLTGRANPALRRFQAIDSKEGQAIYNRNKTLTFLPHKDTKPVFPEEPKIDFNAMIKVFKKLGMNSFLTKKYKRRWARFADNRLDVDSEIEHKLGGRYGTNLHHPNLF